MKLVFIFVSFTYLFTISKSLKCFQCSGVECNRGPNNITVVDCRSRYCWVGRIFGKERMGCGYKRCSLSFLSFGTLFSNRCCPFDYCNGTGKPTSKKKKSCKKKKEPCKKKRKRPRKPKRPKTTTTTRNPVDTTEQDDSDYYEYYEDKIPLQFDEATYIS
ncbi:hypothetical protein SNEBB_007019 [Seison nebaliae]|nr:hypothetical protein SNEBB_007019 [Seison nebaliae]